jgi:tape measure domain-containing protein
VADSLGKAVLTLTVDDKQFNAGLNQAKQKAEGAFASVKGPNLGGAFGAITTGLAGAAASVVAVGAAVAGIGFAATQSAGQIQKLTAAFTGLTGSAEAAAQLRQALFDLSKTTPFKNEEILQSAQRFLAVGVSVENLNGTINRVGAIAAQSGQSLDRLALIYAQVFAKGRLTGEENLQLLEAGVDLTQELSQVTGLSGRALQDAMSKGQIGIDKFNAALVLATGDMKALELAGESVDTQFNNIFDNLGQLFGGFATALAPALSAAFRVINEVFDAAFPDLDSITKFFAPLTQEAQRFAQVLGDSPGVIEVIAAGLRSLGEVVIKNIADGISFISTTLENIDQEKFIQGFINAEIAVRRVFLAASALGAQLAKNAELSFRAVRDPGKFFQDITKAGGLASSLKANTSWSSASGKTGPTPSPSSSQT